MSMFQMRKFPGMAFVFLLMALLAVTLMGSTVVRGKIADAATAQKCGQWSIIPSANPQAGGILTDVATITAKDVWGVGLYTSNQGFSQTFAEHWNGKEWKTVSTPDSGANGNYLRGVVALASNNVWAVGYYQSKSVAIHTLIEHWDGTAWKIVTSPNVGTSDNFLFHVAGIAPNDIWAVGYSTNSAGLYQTLIEHWDGTVWKVVASPNVKNDYNVLNSVAVVAKDDIWSVGQSYGSPSSHTLIERWNGTSWQIVKSPNDGGLLGMAAVSANDVWAVGNTSRNNRPATLVEHWNGSVWKVVASPTPVSGLSNQNFSVTPRFGVFPNTLQGLAVVAADNIWAVGNYINGSNTLTLIEHWNGKQWSIVPSPNLNPNYSTLWSAARVGTTNDVWAVGYAAKNGTTSNSLTEYYC